MVVEEEVLTNSDVDNHINVSGASSGEVLGWNGSDYDWVAQTAAYTNSDVDNDKSINCRNREVLSWNGSDYDWVLLVVSRLQS